MRRLETCRKDMWPFVLASLLVLPLGRGSEAGLSFTGGLERVGDHSISIKLPDRRVIDAMLPNAPALAPSAIAAQYNMGDEVEISCKPIPPVWEAATSRFQSLEVTAVRFVRRPSPEEVLNLLEAKPREGKNLLQRPRVAVSTPDRAAGSGAPGGRELEHARLDQFGIRGEHAQFRGRRNCEALPEHHAIAGLASLRYR